MPDRRLRRVVVLGTGTGVGKTRLTVALARALRRIGPTLALKPLESGGDADARAFDVENSIRVEPHPLIALSEPLSPHLAARREGRPISVAELVSWVAEQEARLALYDNTSPYIFSVVESAGGALSPLSREARNLELARALDPAQLLLVGPDSLGVLHALGSTLIAMAALGRPPDRVALSAANVDASTGTNADELRELGIADPAFVLGPDEDDATTLAEALLSS
ncbi:MAG: dethiobiotin synthase [Myxococcales bacterium]|nr:dethiobiotin synthase [Myxococcales bacterium]